MPNRLIKESIRISEKINKLSDFHFRLWAYLITYVDDYGRGDARPAIIKGQCFPLRERVTIKDIDTGLHVLADTGCIHLYDVDGESYLCFPNWDKHQTIRNQKSRFPAPEGIGKQLKSIESNCKQLKSTASKCSRNPNPNPNPNTESESNPNTGGGSEYIPDREGEPHPDRLIVYATDNLKCLSANNLQELDSFRGQLTDDMIIWAIDETSAKGQRNYSYLRAILNRFVDEGLRSLGEVKAYEEARRRRNGNKSVAGKAEGKFAEYSHPI
ncbi:MAG: DnaD domain protein [Clostridiales bacterium]|nr:DnaD domain protein [Clostridiales bacterium]